MLDTNTCVFLMKNRMEVVEQYKRNKRYGIAISMITVSELQFGVYNSERLEKNAVSLAGFLTGFDLLDYDGGAAFEYGRLRAALRRNPNRSPGYAHFLFSLHFAFRAAHGVMWYLDKSTSAKDTRV
jgi:tRNA(fMet)-specific endonuclease VapC